MEPKEIGAIARNAKKASFKLFTADSKFFTLDFAQVFVMVVVKNVDIKTMVCFIRAFRIFWLIEIDSNLLQVH